MIMAIIKRIEPPHTTEDLKTLKLLYNNARANCEMYRKQIAMQQKYIDFLLDKYSTAIVEQYRLKEIISKMKQYE